MSSLEIYMNDPDIIDEPMPLREVHAIRLKICDETRNMTIAERVADINRRAREVIARYGLRFGA